MKKIVVMSDNHGAWRHVDYIKEVERGADYFIHCGDNVGDDRELDGWFAVRGNCDIRSSLPLETDFRVEGLRVCVLHGHQFDRNLSEKRLFRYMKEHNYDILLFGHTHCRKFDQEDGRIIINPGSTARSRLGAPTYAVVIINEGKVSVEFKEM